MSIILDNIELDETNTEFNWAADFVKNTDCFIYVTGKAGTGKTTFLKYLKATVKKNIVILAPTGVAAINAGGQTIHSFFHIAPSVYVPNDKRLRKKPDPNDKDTSTIYDHFRYFQEDLELIRGIEILIIDEISMVRCDLLDVIDRLLRIFRKNESVPFGGVQVILIGDTFQLPPIAKSDEWDILKNYYKSPYFFDAQVISIVKPKYIELKKIYRQNEQEFIDLLNRIRLNQINHADLVILNSKYNPTFRSTSKDDFIILGTHNEMVNNTNLTKLYELESELKIFEADVINIFPENIMPTERILQLKEGAQIMFIKNDKAKRYFNGKIAKIKTIEDFKIIAEFTSGEMITLEKDKWDNIKHTWNEKTKRIEEEIIGTFIQFPIKLAWAITVHKSQGLTFEKVFADLNSAFAPGQVYVALSRCTSFNGLVLKTKLEASAIKTDKCVLEFAKNEMPDTIIIKELNSGKADYYYKKSREALKNDNFIEVYENLLYAMKYRNDLATDSFKQYFVKYANRLISFKNRFISQKQNLEEIETKYYNSLLITDELQKRIQILEKQRDEQNAAIKLVLDKLVELEKGKNDGAIKNQELSDQIDEERKISSEKSNLLQTKSQIIENQKQVILQHESEINRLRNLKWHHKLLGRN